jgi:hypothetical protein
MSVRHFFVPRGSADLRRAHPRQCVVLARNPVQAMLASLTGNLAVLETAAPLPVGTSIDLLHPEAGMIPGRVVGSTADRMSIAFNAGNRRLGYAIRALARALARPVS